MAAETRRTVDTPTMTVPLALSYNTRGIAGFTTAITNSLDQRKLNGMYEPVHNAVADKITLYHVKRPGVADSGSTYGTTGQVAYLWDIAAGATTNAAANRWVASTDGNDIRVSDISTTTVVVTAAGYAPAYLDKTIIQGTDTSILQVRHTDGTQRVFYGTAIGSWTEISDSDFTTLAHQGKMEFLNGRGHILARNNRIYSSDLDTLADWSASTFITKQVTQDIGTGLAKLGDKIIAFGTSTMEVFRDVGNATGSPLEALPTLAADYGLESTVVTGQRHYTAELDGRLYWVGNHPKGVYAFNGQRVEKVSSLAVDKILTERQYYHVGITAFQGQHAISILLDLPSASTQRALLFFPQWNDWFEWHSTVFIPQACSRVGDVFLGVGSNQHKLYTMSTTSDNWQDAGTNYTWQVQFRLPQDGNFIKRMAMAGVIGDKATSTQNITIEFSDDDGQTWSTARNIDLASLKKCIYHCGGFSQRMVRLTYTGSAGLRLESFITRIE